MSNLPPPPFRNFLCLHAKGMLIKRNLTLNSCFFFPIFCSNLVRESFQSIQKNAVFCWNEKILGNLSKNSYRNRPISFIFIKEGEEVLGLFECLVTDKMLSHAMIVSPDYD